MKEFLDMFLAPSIWSPCLVLAGLGLYRLPRLRLATVALIVTGIATHILFSFGPIAYGLLYPLEHTYPPAQDMPDYRGIRTVVVLTGYAREVPGTPITGQVNSASGMRILEAARLYSQDQQRSFIITGQGDVPLVMQRLLLSLGVPSAQVSTERNSATTHDSAVSLANILGQERFFLVTSAGHMPRAMGVFERQGARPVPAPTDYFTSSAPADTRYTVSSLYLRMSDLAVHEYIGMAWYRLRDRMN